MKLCHLIYLPFLALHGKGEWLEVSVKYVMSIEDTQPTDHDKSVLPD